LLERQSKGEIVTGLLFVDESVGDLHEVNQASVVPLVHLPHSQLCPGASELEKLQKEFR
jgi:2-oxoglutarate ferredoxin oxidoreductase subunit beta